MIGNVYNNLTVISRNHISEKNENYWFCRCVCGKYRIVLERYLLSNYIKSCGCLLIDTSKAKTAKGIHMETGKNATKEYHTWISMKERCYNPNNSRYYTHGARGVTVCERWISSYENFLNDMGRAPTLEHSLERKDNDGNYEPGNCKWATFIEQANNKRNNVIIEYKGESDTIQNWCRRLHVNSKMVTDRINSGWSINDAMEKPKRKQSSPNKRNQSSSS